MCRKTKEMQRKTKEIRRAKRAGKFPCVFHVKNKGNTKEIQRKSGARSAPGILIGNLMQNKGNAKEILRKCKGNTREMEKEVQREYKGTVQQIQRKY